MMRPIIDPGYGESVISSSTRMPLFEHASTSPAPSSPRLIACVAVIAVPCFALILMVAAIALLVLWPFAPVWLYREQIQKINKLKTQDSKETP